MLTRGQSSGLRRPGLSHKPAAAGLPGPPSTSAVTAAAFSRARAVDEQALLELARQYFVSLQAAWDRADFATIGAMAAEPLLQDLRDQLAQRGPGPHHTEVLHLHARLLMLEELREACVASVEFTGLIREHQGATPAPFRELWLLADVKSTGRGWQLARVQSLS